MLVIWFWVQFVLREIFCEATLVSLFGDRYLLLLIWINWSLSTMFTLCDQDLVLVHGFCFGFTIIFFGWWPKNEWPQSVNPILSLSALSQNATIPILTHDMSRHFKKAWKGLNFRTKTYVQTCFFLSMDSYHPKEFNKGNKNVQCYYFSPYHHLAHPTFEESQKLTL